MIEPRPLSHCLRCGASNEACHTQAAMSGSWCCASCWHVGVPAEHEHEHEGQAQEVHP